MTNPFTAFAFEASGTSVNTNIDMPDRLAYVKNVKDFGATGAGFPTDDWAAIMAAFDWTSSTTRGTIFFPPGNYYVSAPIDIGPVDNIIVELVGVYGASVITGGFADYIIKKANLTSGNPSYVENLTIINTDANGGGIRLGGCVGSAVRNCVVTANRGINNATADSGLAGAGALENSIENCILSPGSNPSNSIGVMTSADGPVFNCRFVGFQVGLVGWGQEGAQYISGCYFEGCQTAILPGSDATFANTGNSGMTISGCWFKNNGTAIGMTNSNGGTRCVGLQIEADQTVTVFGSRPQYGINMADNVSGFAFFAGINITGQYDQYGFFVGAGANFATFLGVQVSNTSSHGGLPWSSLTTPANMEFKGCNIAPVFSFANFPTMNSPATGTWLPNSVTGLKTLVGGSGYVPGVYSNVPLTGGSGSGAVAQQVIVDGTGTVVTVRAGAGYPTDSTVPTILPTGSNYAANDVLSASNTNLGGSGSGFSVTAASVANTATITCAFLNLNPYIADGIVFQANIQGMSPSGYNGVFTGAIATGGNTLAFTLSNPSGSGTGGTIIALPSNTAGAYPVLEGACYNISDANTATWGASAVGGGSTHAKIRFNTSVEWTVVGI